MWFRLVAITKEDGVDKYEVMYKTTGGMPKKQKGVRFIHLEDSGFACPKVEVSKDGILELVEDHEKINALLLMKKHREDRKERLEKALKDAKNGEIDQGVMVDLLEDILGR